MNPVDFSKPTAKLYGDFLDLTQNYHPSRYDNSQGLYNNTLQMSGHCHNGIVTGNTNNTNTISMTFRSPALYQLISQIGYPDLVAPVRGGIAIWSHSTMSNNGYPFIRRLEVLDETVKMSYPDKHNGNVYAWITMDISPEKLEKILSINLHMMYDKKKKLLIIRSFNLNSIIVIAKLIHMYNSNRISFYDIQENDLIKKYYQAGTDKKTCEKFRRSLKRAIKTQPF